MEDYWVHLFVGLSGNSFSVLHIGGTEAWYIDVPGALCRAEQYKWNVLWQWPEPTHQDAAADLWLLEWRTCDGTPAGRRSSPLTQ